MTKKKAAKTKRQAIVVLGMHRSGTSALSGMLNLFGCDTPLTPMVASDANEKGFFESLPIYEMHKELLDSAGSSWLDWQPVHEGWFTSVRAEEFQHRAATIVAEEFGTSRLFVLKDPRICRLVPFWVDTLEAMKIKPLILHVHRNPFDVVASLSRHHNISKEFGILVWLRHVLDAERDTRALPRYFTSYERVLTSWGRDIKRIENQFGINFPRQSSRVHSEVASFLEGSLRHFDTSAAQLIDEPNIPDIVRTTFEILEDWSKNGEDSAAHAKLDQIREDLSKVGPVFSGLVSNSESFRKKFSMSEVKIREFEAKQKEHEALQAEFDRIKQEREDTKTRLSKIEAQLSAEVATSRQIALDLESSEAAIAAMHEDLALAQNKLLQRNAELDQMTQKIAAQDASMAERTARIEELEKDIQTRFLETTQLTQMLHDAEQRATAERYKAQTTLSLLEQELSTIRASVTKYEASAHEKAKTVESQHATIAAQQSQLTTQEDYIAELKDSSNRLSAQLSERTATLQKKDIKLGELESNMKSRFAEIAALTRHINDVEEKIAAERLHREKLEYANMALQTSTSWRVTAPIRKLASLFRRNQP